MKRMILPVLLGAALWMQGGVGQGQEPGVAAPEYRVRRCADFELGSAEAGRFWSKAETLSLRTLWPKAEQGPTTVRALYSGTGIYVRFDCTDQRITVRPRQDFDPIYLDDVVEVFLQPSAAQGHYYEYNLSPLGPELILLVVNDGRRFRGWRPWITEEASRTRRRISAAGEPLRPGAKVSSWTAEIFLPYRLLSGSSGLPPRPRDVWRGNFTRIDYDAGEAALSSWISLPKPSFHQPSLFGKLVFD